MFHCWQARWKWADILVLIFFSMPAIIKHVLFACMWDRQLKQMTSLARTKTDWYKQKWKATLKQMCHMTLWMTECPQKMIKELNYPSFKYYKIKMFCTWSVSTYKFPKLTVNIHGSENKNNTLLYWRMPARFVCIEKILAQKCRICLVTCLLLTLSWWVLPVLTELAHGLISHWSCFSNW